MRSLSLSFINYNFSGMEVAWMTPELIFALILIVTAILLTTAILITKKLKKTKWLFIIIPAILIWALVCFMGLSIGVIRAVREMIGPGFPATF